MSNQRLSRLRKAIQIETSDPTELVQKQEILSHKRFSDVVLPRNCEQPARKWLDSQPEDVPVQCKKHPRHHGNARKRSNCAKSDDIMERFLLFVGSNSASNGRKEGSSGKTFYFDRKFTQIRTPDKKDPQFEYKCKHSVLFEFNRTLTEDGLTPISVGTFHNWLKQHRPYIGICPSMSDYCDKCKEFEEEISWCQQIINRLIQSGHATEGEYMHISHTHTHTQHTQTHTHSLNFIYVKYTLLLQGRSWNRNQRCLNLGKITRNTRMMHRMP